MFLDQDLVIVSSMREVTARLIMSCGKSSCNPAMHVVDFLGCMEACCFAFQRISACRAKSSRKVPCLDAFQQAAEG